MFLSACTVNLTFQNVSTHGIADDVVDSEDRTETEAELDAKIPTPWAPS